MFLISSVLLFCVIEYVYGHGALVSLNSQPYASQGEGLYGARNWRAHMLHQGSLRYVSRARALSFAHFSHTHREWDPYSLAGQGGRQDPVVGSESDWANIACGEPGQTQHNIQYDTLASGWKVPGSYEPGSQIQFDVKITANHGGIFEFRHFCADTKIANGQTLSYFDFYDVESSLTDQTSCHNSNPESNIFYNGNCYVRSLT